MNGLRGEDLGRSSLGGISLWLSLRSSSADEYYLWDSYWLTELGYENCHVIKFDAGFNEKLKEPDCLSSSWFDRKAKVLLDRVKGDREAYVCAKSGF